MGTGNDRAQTDDAGKMRLYRARKKLRPSGDSVKLLPGVYAERPVIDALCAYGGLSQAHGNDAAEIVKAALDFVWINADSDLYEGDGEAME